jgi:hypothetical protein
MLVYPPSLVKNGPASKSNISKKLKVPKHSAHIMFLYNFKKNFFYFFLNFQKSELLSPYILANTLLYTNIPQEVSKKKVEILTIDFFSY